MPKEKGLGRRNLRSQGQQQLGSGEGQRVVGGELGWLAG
jgi:hypothetical protein